LPIKQARAGQNHSRGQTYLARDRLPGGQLREARVDNARRPAVRYAEDDECPTGCGHPEPAVLADWQLAGLMSAVFLCGKESGIPGQAATGRVSIASRASGPCVGLDPGGSDHSDFPGPAGRPIAGPSHLTVNRASRVSQPDSARVRAGSAAGRPTRSPFERPGQRL
jgi:hypothetical protein